MVLDRLRVANGFVRPGDKIGIAVTAKTEGTGLRTGRVLAITGIPLVPGGAVRRILVKVLITGGSYLYVSRPYVKTYEHPMRMVKL